MADPLTRLGSTVHGRSALAPASTPAPAPGEARHSQVSPIMRTAMLKATQQLASSTADAQSNEASNADEGASSVAGPVQTPSAEHDAAKQAQSEPAGTGAITVHARADTQAAAQPLASISETVQASDSSTPVGIGTSGHVQAPSRLRQSSGIPQLLDDEAALPDASHDSASGIAASSSATISALSAAPDRLQSRDEHDQPPSGPALHTGSRSPHPRTSQPAMESASSTELATRPLLAARAQPQHQHRLHALEPEQGAVAAGSEHRHRMRISNMDTYVARLHIRMTVSAEASIPTIICMLGINLYIRTRWQAAAGAECGAICKHASLDISDTAALSATTSRRIAHDLGASHRIYPHPCAPMTGRPS